MHLFWSIFLVIIFFIVQVSLVCYIGLIVFYASFFVARQLSICPNDGPSCCNSRTEETLFHLAGRDMSDMVDDKFAKLNLRFSNFLSNYEGGF